MPVIAGAIITTCAMGCQREIAHKLIDHKLIDRRADHVLALKAGQGALRADVALCVNEQKANDFKDTTLSQHRCADGGHGRTRTRKTTGIHDVGRLAQAPRLAGAERHRHG